MTADHSTWKRAPSHGLPTLPPAADLARMLRDEPPEDVAARYGRSVQGLWQILRARGFTISDRTSDDGPPAATFLYRRPDWMDDALCAQVEPEIFFPPTGVNADDAKAVCQQCPAREMCLKWALDTHQAWGVWGGLSERERRRLRKASAC